MAEYDLNALAARAGVTARTVRYYVQQGLLPKPGHTGPGYRYDEDYLTRLRLIRWWQAQHLPLAEIRKKLDSPAEVEAALLEIRKQLDALQSPAGVEAALNAPISSAIDYVRSVIATPSVARSSVAEPKMVVRAGPMELPHETPSMAKAADIEPSGPRLLPSINLRRGRGDRSQWERIALTEDIELHVRRPLSRHANRRVEKLLDLARRIFEEEPY